jgi:hypothetical protein
VSGSDLVIADDGTITVPSHAVGGTDPRRVVLMPPVSIAPHHPWHSRLDPHYDPQVADTWCQWMYKSTFESTWVTGPAGPVSQRIAVPNFEPLPPGWLDRNGRAVAALGFLGQHHHALTSQLAAHGGWDRSQAGRILTPLWKAGLIEYTQLNPKSGPRLAHERLWRLRTDGNELAATIRDLADRTWAYMTCGFDITKPGAGRSHHNHNLHATELALRCYEAHPTIATVWGEPCGDPWLLAPEWLPSRPAGPARWRADAVLVRTDGLRIAIELTRDVSGGSLAGKAQRWANLLAGGTPQDTGLLVMFVNIATAETHKATGTAIRNVIEQATDPNQVGGATASKNARAGILAASWREWFPHPWHISDAFFRLDAAYCRVGASQWGYVAAADATQLVFNPTRPGFDDTHIAANYSAATPRWDR